VGRGASYTADSLALLTGRKRAYGYRYTEAFLSQVAYADGADSFTSALACWSTQLWHPPQALAEDTAQPHTLTCYVDGHRKPAYSDVLLPRGLIGRLGVVLGCRALLLLHDEHGHPLFVTTVLATSFESRTKRKTMHEKHTFILFSDAQRHCAWDICSQNQGAEPVQWLSSAILLLRKDACVRKLKNRQAHAQ